MKVDSTKGAKFEMAEVEERTTSDFGHQHPPDQRTTFEMAEVEERTTSDFGHQHPPDQRTTL